MAKYLVSPFIKVDLNLKTKDIVLYKNENFVRNKK